MKSIPELKYLLAEVEKHYGRKVLTTTDFEALSVVVEHECGEMISASTLKRLWGYVTNNSVPRVSTLNVLCRYLGIRDFSEFCKKMKESAENDSVYFSTKTVCLSDLLAGTRLRIGWMPDRIVEITLQDSGRFHVDSSMNSRLLEGDEFEASSFMLGYPLFIPMVYRDGEALASYIAGQQHGLTTLEIITIKNM